MNMLSKLKSGKSSSKSSSGKSSSSGLDEATHLSTSSNSRSSRRGSSKDVKMTDARADSGNNVSVDVSNRSGGSSKKMSSSKIGTSSSSRQRSGMKSKKSNRQAIQGGPVDDVKDYVPPNVPKSDSARALIYKAIKPNVLFRTCDKEELSELIDSFQPIAHAKGSIVIQEGDEGDGFYVLSKGSVSVYEQTEYKVTMSPGSGFGEIALLYSCPRTASIKAEEDCKLWVMDRRAFRVILSRHKKKRLNMKLMLLEKVKIHDKLLSEILKPNEMQSVAMAAKFQLFNAQEIIVRQGEKGDAFYMIQDGLVDVYIAEKNNGMPVVSLKKGTFFGEKALLSSDVRTATCVAQNNVKCLVLGREDFVRMLGDLEYLMNRNYDEREGAPQEDEEPELIGAHAFDTNVHPKTKKFDQKEWDIKRTLGVGAYGFVKLVHWNRAPTTNSEVFYALKCVSTELIEEKNQEHKIKREQDIMVSLVHPFIARCYTVMEDPRGKYFLMEALCGGELCELLYFEQRFTEEWSMFYSAGVLAGFAHMHEKKVAYRDLKPENLVLDSAGYVKIVDFGLAKVIDKGQTYTFCGTPDYLAPEVILSEGHDWAVDYWGLGVLIYEMTEGMAPFYADAPMETYRKALSGNIHIPDHFTVVVANLIKKLLHTEQAKRLGRTVGGTTAIMCHRWYSNFDWDALLEYRLEAPYIPEEKDPDHHDEEMDGGDVEGFAKDFL